MKIFRQLKCIFADILYLTCSPAVKAMIDSDIRRYIKWNDRLKKMNNPLRQLNDLLLSKVEFRSVFYFRTKQYGFLRALSRLCLPNAQAVEISGEIGPGLLISHRHSVICPEKSGQNLRVGPGAVIGSDNGSPVLGNNVYVASNAVVVGKIRVGDNVIVGAGSVVKQDLESNAVYVGNPARLVKRIEEKDALLDEIT